MVLVVQVTLPYACAGVVVQGNRIVRAAPLLGWSVGKQAKELVRWVQSKGGEAQIVSREETR